ncbi:MAG TPA: InlB B-repeat-containing protein, partial [Bacteroidales bacterium]|nr:InlB B-repeat-containing protein [Bacteroidales bacterium]
MPNLLYDGNTNTGGTAPVDGSSPYLEGATVTVLGLGDLVKTGYRFIDWNTAADGSGTNYDESDTFLMPATDVTLYAQWAAEYALTYDGNGNTGGTATVDPSSPYLEGDTVTVLGYSDLEKTGNLFTGWNTASDGSGT